MKKTYSTKQAAAKIGIGFRTLNRWLARGSIRPSVAIPMAKGARSGAGRTRTSRKGRKVKAAQKPGPEGEGQAREDAMTTRMAIYARVSTTNHGQDVGLQTRDLEQFAEARGWQMVDAVHRRWSERDERLPAGIESAYGRCAQAAL